MGIINGHVMNKRMIRNVTKLYRSLGTYKIFEFDGYYGIKKLVNNQWITGCIGYFNIDDAKDFIFTQRYLRAKYMRKPFNSNNVVYIV